MHHRYTQLLPSEQFVYRFVYNWKVEMKMLMNTLVPVFVGLAASFLLVMVFFEISYSESPHLLLSVSSKSSSQVDITDVSSLVRHCSSWPLFMHQVKSNWHIRCTRCSAAASGGLDLGPNTPVGTGCWLLVSQFPSLFFFLHCGSFTTREQKWIIISMLWLLQVSVQCCPKLDLKTEWIFIQFFTY
jgi:hypothetical protein